ncbi:MAG: alpha-1,2-fucosyltransferase [Candidatus Vogelbacteria bacterium]|nr:alpha-1,2-fucosyltransferase [Candidatus Vogelbacteria bacterium]
MIVTELYSGQGLGNQLFCYVVTRVIAKEHGFDFGIMSPHKFKGGDFMTLDFGKPVGGRSGPEGGPPARLPDGIKYYHAERKITHPDNGADIRYYDERLTEILDNTKVDGYMQNEQYILHRKNEIREWLKIKSEYEYNDFSDDNICVINFRGTGYVNDIDTFLTKTYWQNAVGNMLKINPKFKFIVITEDIKNAKKFFPKYEVYHFSIGKDYAIIKNAKYLILSNSSFAWFPAWLNENLKLCIAPKYWARHNISDGYWSLGYSLTSGWMYQDRNGDLQDYQTCLRESKEYIKKHKELFSNNLPFKPSFAKSIKSTIQTFETFRRESSIIIALKRVANLVLSKMYIKIKTSSWRLLTTIRRSKLTKPARRIIRQIIYSTQNRLKKIKWAIEECIAKKTWLSPREIKEYRKKIKIYDAFNFFNELDLLEIRLNILNPYVDYFVLIESPLTHSGLNKELFYQNNKHLFKKFEHKIIHYVIPHPLQDFDDAKKRIGDPRTTDIEKSILRQALSTDTIRTWSNAFLRDFYEKECVKIPLIGLSDNDFCFVSDLDEIWNPELFIDYSKDDIFKPLLDQYVFYLNNRSNEIEGGTGTIGTKYKNIKNNCLNHLRSIRKTKYVRLSNGGWHFTFQGGEKMIKKKLEAYSYQWGDNNASTKSKIAEKVLNNEDVFGRYFKFWKDERSLPDYILKNRLKYQYLLR